MDTTIDTLNLGRRVRRQRLWLRLSLAELADRCEINKGYLSRIENGKVTPAVGTLANLAAALGVSVGDLLGERAGQNAIHLTATATADGMTAADRGYQFLAFGAGRPNAIMQPMIFSARRGEIAEQPPLRHVGEEFVYVLEGRLRFRVGDSVYELGTGDSLVFDSDEPHDMQAVSETARWLAVFAAPPQTRRLNESGASLPQLNSQTKPKDAP